MRDPSIVAAGVNQVQAPGFLANCLDVVKDGAKTFSGDGSVETSPMAIDPLDAEFAKLAAENKITVVKINQASTIRDPG